MTSTADIEVLTEMFEDKYNFSGKPEEVFLRYCLPIKTIKNITQKVNGRSKSFIFQDKEFKRVELVAKAYYENLGYLVSWSEGFAIDLLEAALTAEVVSKVSKYFKISDTYLRESSYQYEDLLKTQKLLETSDPNSYYTLKSSIRALYNPSLIDANLIKYPDSQSSNDKKPAFIELLISEEEIKHKIQEAIDLVIAEKNIERIENSMLMHLKYMQELYSNGILPQNMNIWSLEFTKVIFSRVGFDKRFININTQRNFICRGFDLTLIDENNELTFVEVKNKDKFTLHQCISIGEYLENPSDKIELCLIDIDENL